MKKIFDFKKIVLLVLIQIVCGIFLFAEDAVEEKKLTVEITNVTSEDGQIILAIYNSSDNYDKRIAFQEVKIKPETDIVRFETLDETTLPDYFQKLVPNLFDKLFCNGFDIVGPGSRVSNVGKM